MTYTRYLVVLLVLTILALQAFSPIQASTSSSNGSITLKLYIGGYILNRGSEPVYVNETDLLVFPYPLLLNDQKIIEYHAYVNNVSVPEKYINISVSMYHGTLWINESFLKDNVIEPNEKIYAAVEYIIEVNMTLRRKPLGGFIGMYPGDWNAIIVANKTLIEETRLWNYSNPLVNLLADYMLHNKKYNKTPYDYVLGLLKWFDENIHYATRIPPRQPWEVIAFRKGDCDDQSNLFITLLRAAGIPSYLETGVVYISKDFMYSGSSADGYYKYKFIGGGGHGWVVAYIPPWGYLRIDLTFGATGRPKDHILLAAYYTYPTVVLEKIVKGDYTVSTQEFISEIREKKLEEEVTLIIQVITGEKT